MERWWCNNGEQAREREESREMVSLHFAVIDLDASEQQLVEGLRAVCPWIEGPGPFTVEMGYLSQAAEDYLLSHGIGWSREVTARA